MVPRKAKPGTSFKGAAAYYLHDKGSNTSDRVAWVETVNLATNDPEQAWRQMAATAMNADHLKQAAGVASTGRKSAKAVYAYSLSWSPNENPSRQDMSDAARATLKVLGMDDRQAMIIAHQDAKHPHVHVLVNRVSPENGLMAKDSVDHLKLSRWAQKYCQDRGWDYCPKRKDNNAARDRGEFVKYYDDRYLWRRTRTEAMRIEGTAEKAALTAMQRRERDALENRIKATRGQIRETWKPIWRNYYDKRRRREGNTKRLTRSFMGRVNLVMTRGADFGLSARDVFRPNTIRKAVSAREDANKAHIVQQQRQDYEKRLAPLETHLARMKQDHSAELRDMDQHHRSELQQSWDKQKRGGDAQDFKQDHQQAKSEGMTIRELMIERHGLEAVLKAEAEARARSKAREQDNERTWEGERKLER